MNQWVIYDAYERHEIAKESQEEKERKKMRASYEQETGPKGLKMTIQNETESKEDAYHTELSKKFMKAARILERMVNQVIYDQATKGIPSFQIMLNHLENLTRLDILHKKTTYLL